MSWYVAFCLAFLCVGVVPVCSVGLPLVSTEYGMMCAFV